jgi:hypothetical protein
MTAFANPHERIEQLTIRLELTEAAYAALLELQAAWLDRCERLQKLVTELRAKLIIDVGQQEAQFYCQVCGERGAENNAAFHLPNCIAAAT